MPHQTHQKQLKMCQATVHSFVFADLNQRPIWISYWKHVYGPSSLNSHFLRCPLYSSQSKHEFHRDLIVL